MKILAALLILPLLTAQLPDLSEQISPVYIIPEQNAGYGFGEQQLAQPFDLEILSDRSLLITD